VRPLGGMSIANQRIPALETVIDRLRGARTVGDLFTLADQPLPELVEDGLGLVY
jgi:hypothetical protein